MILPIPLFRKSFQVTQVVTLGIFIAAAQSGFASEMQANERKKLIQPVAEQKSYVLRGNQWFPGPVVFGVKDGRLTAVCGSSTSISAALDQCNKKFKFAHCTQLDGNWTCTGTTPND